MHANIHIHMHCALGLGDIGPVDLNLNKHAIHHFGGMLALKSGLRFIVSASKVPFFGSFEAVSPLKMMKSTRVGGNWLN